MKCVHFLPLANNGTEESYFPAIPNSFEFSQVQPMVESNTLWNRASAHGSFKQPGTAASPALEMRAALALTHWWSLCTMYHALRNLVDALVHDCPKLYGCVLASGNPRTKVSACIASLRLPRTWNSVSAEIIRFLQSPDPLLWRC